MGYARLPLRRRDGAKEGFGLRVASGALAGCTAWSTIYPIDVLRWLQPYVSQAAALCIPGCNPMYPRLQP